MSHNNLPEWVVEKKLLDYDVALEHMKKHAELLAKGNAQEKIWLLEHNHIYTAGSSAKLGSNISHIENIPVLHSNRGGKITYHGPGQRVVYPILNLAKIMPKIDVRRYVNALEQWIINALDEFGIKGEIREDRVGIWVRSKSHPGSEAKIAALGIRISKGVCYHGVSINVNPDLEKFKYIVPCGISEYGVTSIVDLGYRVTLSEFDKALFKHYIDFYYSLTQNF